MDEVTYVNYVAESQEKILCYSTDRIFRQSAAVHWPGRGPSLNHPLQSVRKLMLGVLQWDSLANVRARETLHVPWQLAIDKEWKISSQLGP